MALSLATVAVAAACALAALPPFGQTTSPPYFRSCPSARDKSLAELQQLVSAGAVVDAWYTPQCEADGSWSAEQRTDTGWGSTSRCVDTATGVDIAGTWLPRGVERTAPCGATSHIRPPRRMHGGCEYKAPKAEKEHRELVQSGVAVDAYYIPQCAKDGSYEREQCMVGMVTSCWCVDPMTGAEEPNTRVDGTWGRPMPCGSYTQYRAEMLR